MLVPFRVELLFVLTVVVVDSQSLARPWDFQASPSLKVVRMIRCRVDAKPSVVPSR